MALYGNRLYWEERYSGSASASYEWLLSYNELRYFLSKESLAASRGNYSNGEAQDRRFPENSSDAFVAADTKADTLSYFPPYEECRCLVLGCGNSTFAEDMRDDGWGGPITNVDFSSVVINQMKKRYEERGYAAKDTEMLGSTMKFVCADITNGLHIFDDNSFDLVIMKGTMDA
ncbi:MAG: hypothetical protein SGILL_004979, partial [Bacillariaceae sp.]